MIITDLFDIDFHIFTDIKILFKLNFKLIKKYVPVWFPVLLITNFTIFGKKLF